MEAKREVTVPDLYCSFCRRHASVADKLVGGPGVHICDRCVEACNQVLAGRRASAFAGWASLGDDALLDSLRSAGRCAEALEGSLRDQVRTLRARGISWQRIGDALGVSRQAAQQRFARAVA